MLRPDSNEVYMSFRTHDPIIIKMLHDILSKSPDIYDFHYVKEIEHEERITAKGNCLSCGSRNVIRQRLNRGSQLRDRLKISLGFMLKKSKHSQLDEWVRLVCEDCRKVNSYVIISEFDEH